MPYILSIFYCRKYIIGGTLIACMGAILGFSGTLRAQEFTVPIENNQADIHALYREMRQCKSLSDALDTLRAKKKLSAIRVVPQEDIHKRGPFNALLLGTEILVSPEWIKTQLVPASDVREGDEILPNNICFGIGHLVEHLAHSDVLKSNRYSSKESFLNSRIEAESRAFLAGWNFAIKAAIAQNKGVFLKDKQLGEFLINLRYRVFFIRAMRLSNGQSIVFSPSGLLKDDNHNIQALTNVIGESEMADIE